MGRLEKYTLTEKKMSNKLTHFAIHIDDIERAKNFYEGVFDWGFNSYGQADFLQIKADKSDNGELIGALQSRKFSPLPDKVIGLECSIGVENIDEIIEKVKNNAGQILMPKTAIPYVGYIAKFLDTEGNLICGIQYDPTAR
ncbi:VOC family protein [Lacihabitans sp. CS3-21]|nr:VOC family protein [Lacihabitans sp. CS3-21]